MSSLDKKKTQASTKHVGFGLRLAAALIDGVILMVAQGFLQRTIPFFGKRLFSSLLGAFYSIFLWVNWNGQTVGKRVLAIKVVKEGGGKVTYTEAVIRYLCYFVSALPLLLGFLWVLWDDKKQGWHDKLAKTLVVKE